MLTLQNSSARLPKPSGFKPAGKVKEAARVEMKRRGIGGVTINRYKEGLKYERKAIEHLKLSLIERGVLVVEPCFRFSNGYRTRFCFPDALLLLPDLDFDLLIEIKTRHTYAAWWQLTRLYYPVVNKALKRNLKLLEVVKTYDPGIQIPNLNIVRKPEEAIESNSLYNLYIYTGR